ncbi:hypothetical protein BDV59DRAFT_86825 [Aspergillus ambiguus]|uniref:uncharacterized protein n=1 Tax=Aspergillus ambiguus TaxID=176160 RepID=UPI003CCD0ED8
MHLLAKGNMGGLKQSLSGMVSRQYLTIRSVSCDFRMEHMRHYRQMKQTIAFLHRHGLESLLLFCHRVVPTSVITNLDMMLLTKVDSESAYGVHVRGTINNSVGHDMRMLGWRGAWVGIALLHCGHLRRMPAVYHMFEAWSPLYGVGSTRSHRGCSVHVAACHDNSECL